MKVYDGRRMMTTVKFQVQLYSVAVVALKGAVLFAPPVLEGVGWLMANRLFGMLWAVTMTHGSYTYMYVHAMWVSFPMT